MIPSPSALPSTILAVPPSALNSFESVFWKGVLLMSAAGSHTRVAPEDFRISTRVVTSNVRQPSDVRSLQAGAPSLESARLADTAPADRRKSRRFIDKPFRAEDPAHRHCTLRPPQASSIGWFTPVGGSPPCFSMASEKRCHEIAFPGWPPERRLQPRLAAPPGAGPRKFKWYWALVPSPHPVFGFYSGWVDTGKSTK